MVPAASTLADVAVVGLGPVGAVLATLLAERGLQVQIVERTPDPFPFPRAIALDDEVLRVLCGLPATRDFDRAVNGYQRAAFVDRAGRVLLEMAFGQSRLGFPGLSFFHQPTLERLLREGLSVQSGVTVRTGELVGLQAHDDRVVLELADGARLTARYVVGCDGAASTVRRLLGVAYGGSTVPAPWLVVDVRTERPLAQLPYFSYVCDPVRPSVNMPMPGGHRWEWLLRRDEDPAAMSEPAKLRALLQPWVDPATVEVERAAVYTFHARRAERWRVGRVLLAGDAAHSMPPFAGQGFGAGVRDAAALSWRLAEVVRGGDPEILDQYARERVPHVRRMTSLALLAGRMLQPTSTSLSALSRAFIAAANRTPVVGASLRQGRIRPAPGLSRRALPAHARRLRLAGTMVPNARLRTRSGRVGRLDQLVPPGRWLALRPGDHEPEGSGGLLPVLAARNATVLTVLRPGGLRGAAGDPDPVVEDLDGWLLELLAGDPDELVLVRPDLFLLGVGTGSQLLQGLIALGCHDVGERGSTVGRDVPRSELLI